MRASSTAAFFTLALNLLVACQPKTCDCAKHPTSASPAGQTPVATGAPAVNPGGSNAAAPMTIQFATPPEFVAAPILTLKRGINFGNGFDAPSEGAWGVVLEEKHFQMAKQAGFDHVRLPVRFSAHAQKAAPFTIEETFFQRIDWALDLAAQNGLAIIVDLHHYEELMTDPKAHTLRLVSLWQQIAARYKSRPDSVIFELINEPCKNLDPVTLNGILAQLISEVRKTNPTRTIIAEGFFWAAPAYLKNLELPADPNVVASFHMYQPILFTHQGAPWMEPEFRSTGVVFPGPPQRPVTLSAGAGATQWTRDWLKGHESQPTGQNPSGPAAVAAEFDMATRYAKETGRRLYLGEFGAIDFADATSRENFYRLVQLEAERRGFAWAVWDDGGKMKLMDVKSGHYSGPVARGLFTNQPGEALPSALDVKD
jgi:endoglucanase